MPRKSASIESRNRTEVRDRPSGWNHWTRFIGRFLEDPRSVGAVAPSGEPLATAMAAQVACRPDAKVLELGAGTGALTAALIASGIAPSQITAVERDRKFFRHLRKHFPGLRLLRADAFDVDAIIEDDAEPYSAVISGIPLLNHSSDWALCFIESVLSRIRPGSPFIQFSYGLGPPVPATKTVSVVRAATVWRNLPPARVWVYRLAEEV